MVNVSRISALAVVMSVAVLATGCSAERDVEPETGSVVSPISLPSGFAYQTVASGLTDATAMAFAPDGRLFIGLQGGAVRIVKNGSLLAANFLKVTTDSVNERGLVGIAIDPSFSSNKFVYIFYTVPGAHNRVSRFTATTDVAGAETVLIDFPSLSSAGNHNSGALGFGKDGKLYVAHGDNADSANAQSFSIPFGKILRFNADGSIPTDNPFFSSSSGLVRATWAYGVRNTFTFAIDPVSGKLFGNDVGGSGPEEINNILAGKNYGNGGGPTPTAAVYTYNRDAGRCAITGGTFYNPQGTVNFPSSFVGKYFFSDYCASKIWYMNQDGSGVTQFAANADGELSRAVDLDVGPDGALYFLEHTGSGRVGRIYSTSTACTSNAQCSDNNVCNGAETCVNGSCQAGATLTCNDNNACTNDSCNATSGCVFTPNGQCTSCTSNAQCNDNNSCTTDTCVNQVCQNASNGSCNVTRLEAEASTLTAATVASEAGASGGQYVDGNQGAILRWSANTSGGSATLDFATRSPSGARSLGVFVNNTKVGVITTTTLRPTWAKQRVTATLAAGTATIELRDTEGTAEPDIDYLELTSSGGSGPTCGDGGCNGTETCSTCAADCGPCGGGPTKLSLTYNADQGGWTNVAGLTDGNLTAKVDTGTSPNCVTYNLGGAYTITSARLLEDNAGAWSVGTWKVQYDKGAGFVDAVAYTDTPNAMPAWNTLDFPDVSGVTRVNVCLQSAGRLEAAELEIYGAPSTTCGDWACNGGETCSSCPSDCGACTGGAAGLSARPSNPDCLAGASSAAPPATLSASPCFSTVGNPPVLKPGVIPYSIAEAFWSDGATKSRYFALPNGTTFSVGSDGDFTLPPGGVTIKNFQWNGVYFETRFFVRYTDGSYGAWTYQWNDAQTDATLVPAGGASKTLPGGHVWDYPTRTQCFDCHTAAAGGSLGLETRQLNVSQLYPSTGITANQFATLSSLGMLSGTTTALPPFPGHTQTGVAYNQRAEAYLHVNCSNCHRPGGTGQGTADYRFDTPLPGKNICNAESFLPAYPGLDLVEPGHHDQSVVWLRMSQRQANFMPPIASKLADAQGANLLQTWIDQLVGCPGR